MAWAASCRIAAALIQRQRDGGSGIDVDAELTDGQHEVPLTVTRSEREERRAERDGDLPIVLLAVWRRWRRAVRGAVSRGPTERKRRGIKGTGKGERWFQSVVSALRAAPVARDGAQGEAENEKEKGHEL